MGVGNFGFYDQNGRVKGDYVYLLLCRDDQKIFIKIGRSIHPEKRFHALRNNCPVRAISFSTIHCAGREIGKRLERELHFTFAKWRITGEWFSFKAEDKAEFNNLFREVLVALSVPSWPLRVVKVSAKVLITRAVAAKYFNQRRWSKRGKAFQDFTRDSS